MVRFLTITVTPWPLGPRNPNPGGRSGGLGELGAAGGNRDGIHRQLTLLVVEFKLEAISQ
jgi:hypothetical protein